VAWLPSTHLIPSPTHTHCGKRKTKTNSHRIPFPPISSSHPAAAATQIRPPPPRRRHGRLPHLLDRRRRRRARPTSSRPRPRCGLQRPRPLLLRPAPPPQSLLIRSGVAVVVVVTGCARRPRMEQRPLPHRRPTRYLASSSSPLPWHSTSLYAIAKQQLDGDSSIV
jgi:hypothetical protein